MKFDFIKNRVLFLSICIFLATVLVLLSVWKQQKQIVEGMVVMDFITPAGTDRKEGDNTLPKFTDMDIQGFISALIPFEKKFETEKKAKESIENYKNSFTYDPSNNEMNMERISPEYLENFIKHLNKTSDSFKMFSESLQKMKKDAIDVYTQEQQLLASKKAGLASE